MKNYLAIDQGTTSSRSIIFNNKLEKTDIKISKLAQGVPAGGDLNYVDNNTLKQAFSWRRELEKNK